MSYHLNYITAKILQILLKIEINWALVVAPCPTKNYFRNELFIFNLYSNFKIPNFYTFHEKIYCLNQIFKNKNLILFHRE
ncbi:hypothetical protein BpHYR1_045530 [Brachionus plicatilis]|uniref:Uncharacterized protein n=1 Tax=Brachionus plicatilis TaxID=10195 RepID=A0A3M7SCU8_BRAPC|nr:hypothetical protein BpHYR1_045530 [Brachionus plicatilis]